MPIKRVVGDIIQLAENGEFDVIIQGCNCMNTFGKGLALAIKNNYPDAYVADCKTVKGDVNKLGTITYANVGKFTIVNAYTQYDYVGPMPRSSVDAIQSCMQQVKQTFSGLRLAYPRVGCGLAGGDWQVVYPIILNALEGEDQTFVDYDEVTQYSTKKKPK